MTQRSAIATEVAHGLWALDAVHVGAPEEVTSAADRVCAQLRAGLTRWVGSEGYRALLGRALEPVRVEHPALKNVSCMGDDEPEIAAAVREHGPARVAAGIVALVVTIVELLGRIVGEEMAVELVKQAGTASPRRAPSTGTEGGRDG